MPVAVVCDLVITEAKEPIVQTAMVAVMEDSKEMDPYLFKKAWRHVHRWVAADIEARKMQKADKLFKRQLLRQSFAQWFQNTDFMPALLSDDSSSSSDESHYVGGGYGPDEGGGYGSSSSSDSDSDSTDMVPVPICWQEIEKEMLPVAQHMPSLAAIRALVCQQQKVRIKHLKSTAAA